MAKRAEAKVEPEPEFLSPETIASLKKLIFKQMTDPLVDVYFKIASKDILAVNRQFTKDIASEDLAIGSQMPCADIIRENIKEYRPYMNQSVSNEMTPEMFAL